MFKRLRRKIIITNIVLFGVLIFGLLGAVYGLAYARMSVEVNDCVERTLRSVRNSEFLMPSTLQESNRIEPNSLALFIDLPERTIGHIAGGMPYDEEFLSEIIDRVLKEPKMNGKIKINDRYLAFNAIYLLEMARIVVYDYTILENSMKSLLYILLGAYAAAVSSLFFILRVYAEKAVRPIEEAFYKQRELIANASHELKTPLTIIDTSLTIINSYKNETIQTNSKWFDNISVQSQRMSYLINDMLELAKADNLQNSNVSWPINISRLLNGVILGMEASLFEHGLSINSQIDEDIIIKGDHESMEKLFYIFIDNAIKYTPNNGEIEIKLYQEKNKAIFSIKNNGSGIAKDKISKLFERFYRVDEAHTQGSSNSFGLGLAIAKSIIDSMGATIDVNSKENEFTEFVISYKSYQKTRTIFSTLFRKKKAIK